jgi:hypothetical protein
MKPSMKQAVHAAANELAKRGDDVTPTAISEALGCSKSTAFRHLQDWEGEGDDAGERDTSEDADGADEGEGEGDAVTISRDHYVALQAVCELALENGRLRRALEAR